MCCINFRKYFQLIHKLKSILLKILTNRDFVLSGGLKSIQQKQASPESKLRLYIDGINSQYPQEIVQYYSPDYAETLIKKLDDYQSE